MEKQKTVVCYAIGSTNYTVVRNFSTAACVEELIEKELNRLSAANILTKQVKGNIMEPYVAGSH